MPAGRNTKRLRWALGLAGVAVVLLAGLAGYQALQAREALVNVAGDFEGVSMHLRAGDLASARAGVESARRQARDADEATSGLIWDAASHAPFLGDDVEAVRTVADVSRALADDVLTDVVTASERLDPRRLRPRNGRIALGPLEEVAPAVVSADHELQRQADVVAAVETDSLVAQLAAPVEELQVRLAEAASLSSRASYAVRLLPPMLGADGPRDYLVLFQNNAEIRATGGIPGAVAVLRADNGKLSLERQGTAADLGYHPQPPLRLTSEEVALYERKLGMFGADVNFTPDFPRTAQIARAMWKAEQGQTVDGVLSADPVALSYLLEGTGPVGVPGGTTLSAANAVDLLLSEVYRTQPDAELQNVFFAAAARAVFDAVASGKGDPAVLLEGLTRSANEGRVFAWSAEPREQQLLADTVLGGAVPREAGSSPYVGVFMNDGTAAKMQYYLEHRVDVEPVSCNSGGRQELEVTVTMTSNAPKNAGALPPSVIGPREGGLGYFGVRPGYMRINVHLYAPIGGWIKTSAIDGDERPLHEVEHLGHPVGSRSVELAPGQTRTLTYTVVSGLDQPGSAHVRVTPGVRDDGVGEVSAAACA